MTRGEKIAVAVIAGCALAAAATAVVVYEAKKHKAEKKALSDFCDGNCKKCGFAGACDEAILDESINVEQTEGNTEKEAAACES